MLQNLRFLDVPVVDSLDDPEHGWKFQAMEDVQAQSWLRTFGNTDEATLAQEWLVGRANELRWVHHWILAVEGPEDIPDAVAGAGYVDWSTCDNLDKVEVSVFVRPQARCRGVGTALLEWCEEKVRESGRTLMMTWAFFGAHEDCPPRLPAAEGKDVPANVDGVSFLIHRGFEVAQAERRSIMEVPLDPALRASLLEATLPHTHGYRLHTWRTWIPEEWIEPYARLMEEFSLDMPSGGIDWQREVWDVERVQRRMSDIDKKGSVLLITVAEDISSGELVGCTELSWRDQPGIEAAEQWITEVVRGHRGHRLGMWMKIANLDAMLAERPGIRRVSTSNAEENSPMLGINMAMGFIPRGGYVMLKKAIPTMGSAE